MDTAHKFFVARTSFKIGSEFNALPFPLQKDDRFLHLTSNTYMLSDLMIYCESATDTWPGKKVKVGEEGVRGLRGNGRRKERGAVGEFSLVKR